VAGEAVHRSPVESAGPVLQSPRKIERRTPRSSRTSPSVGMPPRPNVATKRAARTRGIADDETCGLGRFRVHRPVCCRRRPHDSLPGIAHIPHPRGTSPIGPLLGGRCPRATRSAGAVADDQTQSVKLRLGATRPHVAAQGIGLGAPRGGHSRMNSCKSRMRCFHACEPFRHGRRLP